MFISGASTDLCGRCEEILAKVTISAKKNLTVDKLSQSEHKQYCRVNTIEASK